MNAGKALSGNRRSITKPPRTKPVTTTSYKGIAMSPQERENPLAGNQGAEISTSDIPRISESSDKNTMSALVAGVHVVVVMTSEGKYRRRTFFNLPSAQRSVDRATMAGHIAHIILCKLIPVDGGEEL